MFSLALQKIIHHHGIHGPDQLHTLHMVSTCASGMYNDVLYRY